MRTAVAFGFVYERMMRHRDPIDAARVDMLLGMPGADMRHTRLVADQLEEMGIEVM